MTPSERKKMYEDVKAALDHEKENRDPEVEEKAEEADHPRN